LVDGSTGLRGRKDIFCHDGYVHEIYIGPKALECCGFSMDFVLFSGERSPTYDKFIVRSGEYIIKMSHNSGSSFIGIDLISSFNVIWGYSPILA
jgi:hypothetical protein